METGAITEYIDVAQVVLYIFWIFFAGLVIHLQMESKREGYPLESDRTDRAPHVPVVGFPGLPDPKVYRMPHGEGDFLAPRERAPEGHPPGTTYSERPFPGEPLRPTGDPMRDGVGPASYALREEIPDIDMHGLPKVVPMRVATEFEVAEEDPDPRGMEVIGADGEVAGTVREIWVDRVEPRILFFEVDLAGAEPGSTPVLLPISFVRYQLKKRRLLVSSILASQFAHVPRIANPDQITRREEDKITAYFGSGHLYATPERQEPKI